MHILLNQSSSLNFKSLHHLLTLSKPWFSSFLRINETVFPDWNKGAPSNSLLTVPRRRFCFGLLSSSSFFRFYTPPHKKWWGIMIYPPNRLSVRPSVSASFPDSNLSSFWPIFFKLCMDIDVREEWFGIANGLNSFINNKVMALGWCNMYFSSISSEQMDEFWPNFVYALIYTRSMSISCTLFWSVFNRIMALDQRQNFVYAQYLANQILCMHW